VSLLEIMKDFDAAAWLQMASVLARIDQLIQAVPTVTENDEFPDIFGNPETKEKIEIWIGWCDELELRASAATFRKLLDVGPNAPSARVVELVKELHGRILDEAQNVVFFAVEPSAAVRYNNPRAGWQEAIRRFPEIGSDVEEASKCFALSRFAGSVFHSTQVVEFGTIALGKFVGVTDPRPGFTATTTMLKKLIATPYPQWPPEMQKHSEFLKQLHERLLALEMAWRNKISHAEGKLTLLTADFVPDVAEEIITASRAFMRRLATDLPEDASTL